MISRGKYCHHEKLKFDPDIDTSHEVIDDDAIHKITYIGQEYIPNFSDQNYQILIKKIYGENFSLMATLAHSKRLQLSVDDNGIFLYNPSLKSTQGSSPYLSYKLPDLVFMSTDTRHAKVLAVVSRGYSSDATLSVFVCNDVTEPVDIMEQCKEMFLKHEDVKMICNSDKPESLKIIYKSDDFNKSCQRNEPPIADFQDSEKEKSPAKVTTVDIDDEFSQLALKRNMNLPDHLQDKTVESAFLIQEQRLPVPAVASVPAPPALLSSTREVSECDTDEEKGRSFFKGNFFSSYSRVSTG